MGELLHLVQREEDWTGPQPAQASARCNKCNSPSMNGQCTSTILLYNGPLFCGFNMPIKGLKIKLLSFCRFRLELDPDFKVEKQCAVVMKTQNGMFMDLFSRAHIA